MKLKYDKEFIFSIIGLPRSGTTLLSNIFNSYENSFSLVEPKWVIDYDIEYFTSDKVVIDLELDLISNLYNLVKDKNEFDIGCIKETFRIHQKQYTEYLLNDNRIDSTIFIFREPLSNFSSWKKTKWGSYYDDVDYFIDCYLQLNEIYQNQNNKHLVIYEKLCSLKQNYLNDLFKDEIFFEEIPDLKSTNFKFGDEKANSGGFIEMANCNFENLSDLEIEAINKCLINIYNSLNENFHNN